ncbi:MAG: hypothetical protein J2P17_19070, partial [Mycobacterium sp.]|nr:hypothetical protein [Mycobacterium sp.]
AIPGAAGQQLLQERSQAVVGVAVCSQMIAARAYQICEGRLWLFAVAPLHFVIPLVRHRSVPSVVR